MTHQPRASFRSPRFAQPATFMRLPHVEDPHGLDVAIADAGARPIVIGDDHSISLPILRALAKRHGPLASSSSMVRGRSPRCSRRT
jgi:hypothetical protein